MSCVGLLSLYLHKLKILWSQKSALIPGKAFQLEKTWPCDIGMLKCLFCKSDNGGRLSFLAAERVQILRAKFSASESVLSPYSDTCGPLAHLQCVSYRTCPRRKNLIELLFSFNW